jgi:hypothetical protein
MFAFYQSIQYGFLADNADIVRKPRIQRQQEQPRDGMTILRYVGPIAALTKILFTHPPSQGSSCESAGPIHPPCDLNSRRKTSSTVATVASYLPR